MFGANYFGSIYFGEAFCDETIAILPEEVPPIIIVNNGGGGGGGVIGKSGSSRYSVGRDGELRVDYIKRIVEEEEDLILQVIKIFLKCR